MKIIKTGNIRLTHPWWTRVLWTCRKCQCQVEFGPEDVNSVHEYDEREGAGAAAACPTCNSRIEVAKQTYQADQWGR